MNFLIRLVSLSLIFYIHFSSGILDSTGSKHLCRPSNPTKANCLNHGCLCAWCSLSNSLEAKELSEHNKNNGPLGKCFTYRRHDPAANIKRCGNINATIQTYANFGRCTHMYTVLYIFIYLVIGLVGAGVLTVCVSGAIRWLRKRR